ncbi:MAG TPA: M23 family metallopeptidase [Gaiellaceae bacterium]|jgi:hypothetical protein
MATNTHIQPGGVCRALLLVAACLAVLASTAAAFGDNTHSTRTIRIALQTTRTLAPRTERRGSYGWPVRPFDRQHPVRAFFGDPREHVGLDGSSSAAFHFGIDIAVPDGTPVYAVEAGTVHLNSPRSIAVVSPDRSHSFGYWHIVPAVRSRQVVRRHQLLGHVEAPWGHIHFAERRGGEYVNPLRQGGLGPYTDHTAPTIRRVSVVVQGERLGVVADAYDRPDPAVPGAWAGEPVTPALLRWRLADARGAGAWHVAIDSRLASPPASEYDAVYAPGTRQNHEGRPGRYRFWLSRAIEPSALARSPRLEIEASDVSGNVGRASAELARFSSVAAAPPRGLDADELELIGDAGHDRDSQRPTVTAFFARESYPSGGVATLVVTDDAPHVAVQILRADTAGEERLAHDVMAGTPVTPVRPLGAVRGRLVVRLRLGAWRSGVYFARLTAAGSRVGFAPFVLRPRRLGTHRVAVVLPTQTWQAYNFRDDDGDGEPDTWYFAHGHATARLGRPFLNRGVPPHWNFYDAPFLGWLAQTGRAADYLADSDLRSAADGEELAADYDLIVFPGHHEYVTEHEYDVVTRFRDLGGNLAFLSANDFFWKIELSGRVMTRVARWRDLGRPEAALIGVQYRGNDRGGHQGPWILRNVVRAPWLVDGTRLRTGDGVGRGGIEIDSTASSSPTNVEVLAEIPNLYGPGFTAQMTYYETPAGAKVFAAGAFTLAGEVWEPGVQPLVRNIWRHLSEP